jgi:hypothetical protein
MRKKVSEKLAYLVLIVLVMSLVENAQAAWTTWTDAGADHLWTTATNWDNGTVPTSADNVVIDMPLPGPTVESQDCAARWIVIGQQIKGALTVDAGTLTASKYVLVGQSGEGTLDINGGDMTVFGNDLYVGDKALGTINMTGGSLTIGRDFLIPRKATGTARVNLYYGVITVGRNFTMHTADGDGAMDIGAGTLIIDGNNVSAVQEYIDNGWITAYRGDGTFQLDYNDLNEGKTTLTATHLLEPNPADGSNVSVTVSQLQWRLPEPDQPGGTVTCDVYFGTNSDVEANPKLVIGQAVESASVILESQMVYYWAIDVYDSSLSSSEPVMLSPVFRLDTLNTPPVVEAGKDIVTWLAEGVRVGDLDGTVTDDGMPGSYAAEWAVISEPNDPNSPDAVIADPSSEDTTITLASVGEYILQLEASDGEFTDSDTITINVYNDSCEAAQSLPGYVPLVGDLNGDCRVDDEDLALLEENWLKDCSLTDEWCEIE